MPELHTSLLGNQLTFVDWTRDASGVAQRLIVPGVVVACWVGSSDQHGGRLMVALGLEDGTIVQKPADACTHVGAVG